MVSLLDTVHVANYSETQSVGTAFLKVNPRDAYSAYCPVVRCSPIEGLVPTKHLITHLYSCMVMTYSQKHDPHNIRSFSKTTILLSSIEYTMLSKVEKHLEYRQSTRQIQLKHNSIC